MRIVLDTNILVRANTRSHGPARELLNIIRSRREHVLILSRQILAEIRRTLLYPRLQEQYGLSDEVIQEHIELLQRVSTIIEPVAAEPVVLNDPADDLVVYTAIEGRADVLCTRDADFYAPGVIAFCRQRSIEIMNDVDLLHRLRRR